MTSGQKRDNLCVERTERKKSMEDDIYLVDMCCQSCDGLIAWVYSDDPEPNYPEYCGGQWCKRFPPM